MTARFLLLSEDSGKQAQPTIRSLMTAAAKLLKPNLDTRLLELRPLAEGDLAANALRANAWKQRRLSPEKAALIRTIANELEQRRFVVLHFDSDTTWSKRRTSENRIKFANQLRADVRLTLTTPRANPKFVPLSTEAADERMSRFFAMSPCYSIEAWLYQANDALRSFCRERHEKRTHLVLIERWKSDRALLDEVDRPKDDEFSDCVGDRHNAELAAAFPAAEVFAVEKSWHEFVEVLRQSGPLRAALGLDDTSF
ncbi:MAG: hypothetical protein MUC96_01440 [Myxococcaceae bacterium]|nr:hypothetical protein [Myxococcaceae bacterium]